MKPCRECRHTVSEQAPTCPRCGAPYPARGIIAGFALAQFALGYDLIAQIELYVHSGSGQFVKSLQSLLTFLH
jgi:hypothetical protein